MCSDNHPFVLDKKWLVKRREMAESGLLESHTREDTQRFPTVRSTLAASLSKENTMKESELKLWRITFSVHDGGFLRIESEKHAGCGEPVEMTFSKQDTARIKQWLAEGDVVETHAR